MKITTRFTALAATLFPSAVSAATAPAPVATLDSSAAAVALFSALMIALLAVREYGRTPKPLLPPKAPATPPREYTSTALLACCAPGAG